MKLNEAHNLNDLESFKLYFSCRSVKSPPGNIVPIKGPTECYARLHLKYIDAGVIIFHLSICQRMVDWLRDIHSYKMEMLTLLPKDLRICASKAEEIYFWNVSKSLLWSIIITALPWITGRQDAITKRRDLGHRQSGGALPLPRQNTYKAIIYPKYFTTLFDRFTKRWTLSNTQ